MRGKELVVELGTKVRVLYTLNRHIERVTAEGEIPRLWRVWREHKCPTPLEGIVTGIRTYSDGILQNYDGWEGFTEYLPKRYYQVLLVVTNIRQNPIVTKVEYIQDL